MDISLRQLRALSVVTLAIAAGCSIGSVDQASQLSQSSTYTVEEGELLVTVTEDGNVESANNIDIKCKVAGGSSILWIVEDGKEVKAGDKLVELDAASLEDEIAAQQIAYNKAKTAVIQAEKNHEVAKISVREYLEGTYVQELEVAETQITIAEENLRSAKNSLNYSERMFQRGYISELELESQQFAVKRAQLELNSANTAKKVLEEFTKPKMLEELQSAVDTAAATMESEQAAFTVEENKLNRLKTQIDNCTILAPQDGMVVYANERGGRFGQQGNSTIEEGATVRDLQTILRLPDLAQMQVKVNVHETKVEEIQLDMRARVNVQGRELVGYVTSIANQPESTSFFQGNVKEYATKVKVEGEPEGLKPGMTAEVEILVAHLKGVKTVPVSCIVEKRNQFYCWVVNGGEPEKRLVELGLTNDQVVEVKSGLEVGEQVLRNPRAVVEEARSGDGSSEQMEDEADVTEKFGKERPTRPVEDGPSRGPGSNPRGEDGPSRSGPPGGGRSFNPEQFDKDGDGKVSKAEAPERMQSFFDRIDSDGDGFLDSSELKSMSRPRGGPGGGGPGGRPN
ncbi:MAG: TolC family protein [Planctomycetales bacterium]|nr:TolC family protein [Planctomycetales bacterium]